MFRGACNAFPMSMWTQVFLARWANTLQTAEAASCSKSFERPKPNIKLALEVERDILGEKM